MIDPHALLIFSAAYALASAIPGAAQGVMVATVAARGARASWSFVAGMVAGNAVWLVVAALGLATLATRLSGLFAVVKWAGIAYLAWLAIGLWRASAAGGAPDPARPPAARSALRGFAGGAALTLGNPKAVVFYSAVLPQVFDMSALSAADVAIVSVLGAAIDGAVQCAYVALVSRARRLLASPRALRRVHRGAAVVIAGSAAAIAARA